MSTPTFDIEAMNWVEPIAVGYYINDEYGQVLKLHEGYDVIWEFLKEISKFKSARFYAHNAANYDNKFILDSLVRHGQEVKFAAGLGSLLWIGPNIRFDDSFLLLGQKLAACCEAFDVPRKLDWPHDQTKNPWEMKSRLPTFTEYLKRDCVSLSEAIDNFSRLLLKHFGVTPSVTLSLTSVKAFDKRFTPMQKIASNDGFEAFIRAAIYGGRNEVYKRYGENLHFYDVRRMYMSCYDVNVPTGPLRWRNPDIDKGTLAEASVKVPDMHIGPLPYRMQEGNKSRLAFPTGEFQGWWDMVELRNAVSKGVDVTLLRQLEADEQPILKEFAELVDRLSHESNEALARIWKLFGLRLSGKFGQRRNQREIRHIKHIAADEYNPIDDQEVYHEVYTGNHSKAPYIRPAISMRIRAEARVRHLDYLLQADDVYYSDTDSVYTTNRLPVGEKLGDLKYVCFATKAYFVGNKFYGFVDESGLLKQKTAGYRDYQLSEGDFQEILKGKELSFAFERVGNWKQVLEGKGVFLDERRFTYRRPPSTNRVMGEIETSPIKLIAGKVAR